MTLKEEYIYLILDLFTVSESKPKDRNIVQSKNFRFFLAILLSNSEN
jgi:hypothetical protein